MRIWPVLILLAACTQTGSRPAPAPAPGPLELRENGFGVGGTRLEIGFGRSEEGAIAAADRLIGRSPTRARHVGECTLVDWRDGPSMVFRSSAFVGWIAGERRAGDTCGQ